MESNYVLNGNSKEIIKDALLRETCVIPVENGQRVLGVSARSKITSCETLDGELRVSVKTVFRAIKCDDEGNYFSDAVDCESIHTLSREGITPSTKVCLDATVTECEKIYDNPYKVSATVEISGWFIKTEEITFLNPSYEGLFCKTEKSVVENVVPLCDNTLSLTFTDEARMPIAKILDYSGSVTIDGVYSSTGTYRVEGDLILRIVAVTDNGQFITQNFSHPFSSESAEENVTSEMRIEAEGKIKTLSFTVTENDKRIVVCDATVKICGVVLEEKEAEKTIDAYSIKNEIEIKREKKTVNSHFCMRSVREKATATLTASDGVSEILAVMTPCVSTNGSVGENGINAEGVISVAVIYLDENGKARSITGEIPFLSNLGGDYPCETVFAPEVAVTALGARPRGSNDVEITAELLVTVRGAKTKEITVISDVEIGAEKEEDDFAVSLYIVKEGETLWEVAKELNCDEKTLIEQNPDLPNPLAAGEKILLYKYLPEE